MFVHKRCGILIGCSLAMGAIPVAQTQTKFSRYTKPLRTATMNLETGTISRGPAVTTQGITTTTDLPNLDLGGFIGVDTGGGFCEWIDSAAKGSGAQGSGPVPSDLITNFVFAYCSARLDINSGGTGGSMTWTFYPSHTTGALHPATSDASTFTLTGLPSNTAEGMVFAQIACFFIDITFGTTPLPFADGQVGYSWTFEDLDTGGIAAATFPFLSCVTSCSGAGPDGISMDDLVDQYCPNPVGSAPLATFSFGTTAFGGYFTSLNIDMREVDKDATTMAVAGIGVNKDILQMGPLIIGKPTFMSINSAPGRTAAPAPLGGNAIYYIYSPFTSVSVPLDMEALLFGGVRDAPTSELLCVGTLRFSTFGPWSGVTGPTVPLNLNFVCEPWCAQALVFGDFPNAVEAICPGGSADGAPETDTMWSTAVTGMVGAQ